MVFIIYNILKTYIVRQKYNENTMYKRNVKWTLCPDGYCWRRINVAFWLTSYEKDRHFTGNEPEYESFQ